MATMNTFPPDVPRDWDEANDEIESATGKLRAKAADVADKASETVKDGYHRAKDALTDMDPIETAREGGEAVMRAVERHPVITFGLGALSMGLIAWAALREPPRSRFSGLSSYEPDFGRLRRLFSDFTGEATHSGESAMKQGDKLLRNYGGQARDYADYARGYAEDGGRMLATSARREPVAALLGVGIAVYVIGSLLSSSQAQAEPARRRQVKR